MIDKPNKCFAYTNPWKDRWPGEPGEPGARSQEPGFRQQAQEAGDPPRRVPINPDWDLLLMIKWLMQLAAVLFFGFLYNMQEAIGGWLLRFPAVVKGYVYGGIAWLAWIWVLEL